MKIFCATILAVVAAVIYMLDDGHDKVVFCLAALCVWLVWLDSDSK